MRILFVCYKHSHFWDATSRQFFFLHSNFGQNRLQIFFPSFALASISYFVCSAISIREEGKIIIIPYRTLDISLVVEHRRANNRFSNIVQAVDMHFYWTFIQPTCVRNVLFFICGNGVCAWVSDNLEKWFLPNIGLSLECTRRLSRRKISHWKSYNENDTECAELQHLNAHSL